MSKTVPTTTLRAWRLSRGLSVADVAAALRLSQSRVIEIELGSSCRLGTAVKIEDLTGGMVPAARIWRDHVALRAAGRAAA